MESIQPLVSVIINCYNGEKYLREAIDSVIAQTYTNWEIIFWDNQSTDKTKEIVESYKDDRIHYFYAPSHTPLGEARNLAVEKAAGEYVNFLDADDVWSSNKLHEQIQLIVRDYVELVYTPFSIIFGENEKIDKGMLKTYLAHEKHKCYDGQMFDRLLDGNYIIFSGVLINKQLFKKIGGVNVNYQQYEDYELLLKASLLTSFGVCNSARTYYRLHSGNNTSKNGLYCLMEARDIFHSLPQTEKVCRAIVINETRIAFHTYFQHGRLIDGIRCVNSNGSWSALLLLIIRRVFRGLLK